MSVVAYPLVPGLSTSTHFSMTVDGTSVPVQSYASNSFAWFAFSGTVSVVVTVDETVSTYTLSPLRNPISSTPSGTTVTFSLSAPKHLAFHKVNSIAEKLFIFGDALEVSPPASTGTGIYNIVVDYGADDTGATDSTTEIQNAINAASTYGIANGVGVVYVPAGLFTVNAAVLLKANIHLYLAPTSVIKNIAGTYTSNVAYHVNNQDNVRISGRGVLYGNGTAISSYLHLMHTGTSSGTIDNFQIQDVMLLDSHSTALRLGETINSTVTNLKVLSGSPSLSDGIDTEGVTNVIIDHAFVWSSDDNLAVGSGGSTFNYNVASNTDGYTIKNCLFYQTSTGHVLSCVPFVAPTYIQNVLLKNCDSISVQLAFACYASNGPADLNHMRICNVRVEEVRVKPLDLISTDFFTGWGGCPNGFCIDDSGKINNITFDTVVFDTNGTVNSEIYGRSSTQNIDVINFNAVYLEGVLVTDATTGNLTIGSFVTNVTYTNNPCSCLDEVIAPSPVRTGKHLKHFTWGHK